MSQIIYIVEDDVNIRELVVYALQTSGYTSSGFACAKDFYEELKTKRPDLILLDLMLPDEDGLSIIKKLKNKEQYQDIPVIMVTAKSTEYDKVKGLDTGADDYITKPFGVMELISRIKAVMRRVAKPIPANTLVLGDISLDVEKHEVLIDGEPVNLTYKEFELLSYLIKNKGIVLSRDKILDVIWNYEYEGESRTVDVHIGSLRQKLGNSGNLIETVRGVGYKIGVRE